MPPPYNLRGGGQHTLWPLPIIHPPFPSKNHKCTKLKSKLIINITLILFDGTVKTIPLNSIPEFSIISDFKMRNVTIWHKFIKTLWGHDVEMTSMRRRYVTSTSLRRHVSVRNMPPPPWPSPTQYLNLGSPIF